ncbi:MAG: hypothetical protein ISS71_07395 [Phycisphaerae bacterium]|nr:hypothetical protein [Phycisphaerae bacterium]
MQLSKNAKRFEELTMDELVGKCDRLFSEVGADSDFAAESLLDHIYANPLGKLLRMISTLPEVRHEKVVQARKMIHESEDELDCRMDIALDKVLEELITEN